MIKKRKPWQLENFWLFVCLSALFLVYPHAAQATIARYLLDLIFSGSILLAVYSQSHLPGLARKGYVSIGIAAAVSTWLPTSSGSVHVVTALLYTAFFGISVIAYCHQLLTDDDVDADTILGACCGYLLLGLFFATLYAVIYYFDPKAFSLPEDSSDSIFYHLSYFSFVTLTTLGYGDILPATPTTQMLAAYEAVVGQIFVTVVVAAIVGAHVSNRDRYKGDANSVK